MITSQSIEALAVAASVILQVFILREMKKASAQMQVASLMSFKSNELAMKNLEMATCPVLTLKLEQDGKYSIQNCGQGVAIMVQWAYGKTIAEGVNRPINRLTDNVIPAGEKMSMKLDLDIAQVSGLMLFAYSATNDKYVTTIKWVDGNMMIVNFGGYTGDLPNNP